MDARKVWERVTCTSVGLFRMGRDAVTSFFDRAYAMGKQDGDGNAPRSEACDTDGEGAE